MRLRFRVRAVIIVSNVIICLTHTEQNRPFMPYEALNTAEHFATTIGATFVAARVSAVIMQSVFKCGLTTIDSD